MKILKTNISSFLNKLYIYFSVELFTAIRKLSKKWLVPLFFIIVLITCSLYYLLSFINPPTLLYTILESISSGIGVRFINDAVVKNIILTIISSLTIIVSLVSAIYVFTYREQKSVSPSASTDNRRIKLLITVISLMIFNVIFGSLIINTYNAVIEDKKYETSLLMTEKLVLVITVFSIFMVFFIINIVKFIKYLFRTMSIDSMLEDSVNNSRKLFQSIIKSKRSSYFNLYIENKYRRLHFSIESVFQNLKFAADNNMNKQFEEQIKEFIEVFGLFKEKDLNDLHVSTKLLKEDKEYFITLYHSAIRSNLALIAGLLKNQQYNKAKKAVNLYFKMFIDNDELLIKIFKISLNDFVEIIDTKEEKQLLIFLDGLKEIEKEHHTLLAYKYLLMKLINKKQLINITNIVYDFEIKDKKYKSSLMVILLQGLVKSIEISNYEVTGFLVKFLITNFSGKEINHSLLVLKKNPYAFTKVLEADAESEMEEIPGISEDDVYVIKINNETFDYCYKKAYILLFGQHLFSLQNKLWYLNERNEKGTEIKLGLEFKNCDYAKYMINKVVGTSTKYGLLFFKENEVMRLIYQEIRVNFPKEEKETESSLQDAIGFIVSKLLKIPNK